MKKLLPKTFLTTCLLLLFSASSPLSAMKKNGWTQVTCKKYNSNKKQHPQKKSKIESRFPFRGAGVLPYIKRDSKTYFLISKHSRGKNKGKWGDFGGEVEDSKDTNIIDTAAREAFEESLGYFGNKLFWKNKLKHAKFDILENSKHRFAGISYVVNITKDVNNASLKEIIRGLTNKLNNYEEKAITSPKKYEAYTEKDEFTWVDSKALKMLSECNSYRVPLWRIEKLIQLAQ